LKDGVSVVSEAPGESVIRLEGVAPGAVAVAARNINGARLSGFRIEGGLLIQGAAVDIVDDDITGANDCGVHIEGGAGTTLRANFIHENAGCGVLIEGGASPRLTGNRIARNGTEKRPVRAGVEIYLPSLPALLNNMFEGNGPAIAGDIPPQTIAKLLRANIVIGTGQGASR
jgi:hypothetical protein